MRTAQNNQKIMTTKITVTALLTAVAIALQYIEVPIPLVPSFLKLDFSDLPALQHFVAKDGASLAYRLYSTSVTPANGSVVLVHGSSASSNSMHILAKAFAKAGYDAYALDVRGHGASGVKGQIGYIGQLEDDLARIFHKTGRISLNPLIKLGLRQ